MKNNLKFKVDVPNMFTEIIAANTSMWILKQPLIITDNILKEGAKRAMELKDEYMISIFVRLGMYEGLNKKDHPDHEKLMELSNKDY